MGHWLNVVEANSTGPESGLSTGWLPLADHNGTATVNVGGNTTLTPLQAAKANIRFTGSPAGNSTITFPAWTKRYSIINDCAGDQSLIRTTGNGESISIKNGAKYEIGCDGKNLTVATVNASQVFAEPNKNVSSLEAPTVQQIINALGSAASHAASDFDPAGSASNLEKRLGDSAFWDVKKDNGLAYDYGKLVSEGSVKAEIDNLGGAARWGVQEEIDIWKQEYGKGRLAREATVAAIRDWANNIFLTLKSASTHEASDFDAAGSAQSVLDALNKLEQSLASIAKSGKITDTTGNLSLDRIDGVGDAATFGVNTTNSISYDYGKIPSEGTIKAQFDNLGQASSYGVKVDWDFEKAEYGTGLLAREAAIAALRDALRSTDSTLGFAFAKYIGDSAQGRGAEVAGELLLPASAEYSFDGTRLAGIWKCLGVCQSKKVNIHGQQTTLWVRIK